MRTPSAFPNINATPPSKRRNLISCIFPFSCSKTSSNRTWKQLNHLNKITVVQMSHLSIPVDKRIKTIAESKPTRSPDSVLTREELIRMVKCYARIPISSLSRSHNAPWKLAYNSSNAIQYIPWSFAAAYEQLDIILTFKSAVEHQLFYILFISEKNTWGYQSHQWVN